MTGGVEERYLAMGEEGESVKLEGVSTGRHTWYPVFWLEKSTPFGKAGMLGFIDLRPHLRDER